MSAAQHRGYQPPWEDVEVETPDGSVYKGSYRDEGDAINVRASNGKSDWAATRGTANAPYLAKVVLLQLNGWPRVRWPDGWRPAD